MDSFMFKYSLGELEAMAGFFVFVCLLKHFFVKKFTTLNLIKHRHTIYIKQDWYMIPPNFKYCIEYD